MRRTTAALLILVVLLCTGIAGALDGDPPSSTGWWSQNPGASAQEGSGFEVAALAGQPVSVAAVRFSVPSGVTRATLTLQETGGFVTPASSLQVCKTTEPWEPTNPGAYDDAPTPDCTAPVPLARDTESLVWTAEVIGLLPSLGGEASLMIVPSETAGGGSPLDPGYQVTFSEAALAITAAPGTTVAPSTTFRAPSSPAFSGGSTGGGSSFTPPGPVATTVPITPDTVPVDEQPQSGEAFQPPTLAGGAAPGGGADQPWAKLFFLVPLSAIIGAATVYAKRILQQRGVLEEA
jgi:hypothetical protein